MQNAQRWQGDTFPYLIYLGQKVMKVQKYFMRTRMHRTAGLFRFIAGLRRRRSPNGTEPNFAKRWMVNRAKNCRRKVGVVDLEKTGPKNFYICSVFRRLWDLIANICWTKCDVDNRANALKTWRVSYIVPKFYEIWSTNGLKPGRSFYPPCLLYTSDAADE